MYTNLLCMWEHVWHCLLPHNAPMAGKKCSVHVYTCTVSQCKINRTNSTDSGIVTVLLYKQEWCMLCLRHKSFGPTLQRSEGVLGSEAAQSCLSLCQEFSHSFPHKVIHVCHLVSALANHLLEYRRPQLLKCSQSLASCYSTTCEALCNALWYLLCSRWLHLQGGVYVGGPWLESWS